MATTGSDSTARGERLVEHSEVGLALWGTHDVWGPLALGVYAQYDMGKRFAANFQGLDAENKTIIEDESGGAFHEFWLGPVARVAWMPLFFELGYAPIEIRGDAAREDLETTGGDNTAALRTSYTVAYYAGIGAGVPIRDHLAAVFHLEYRVRYYNRRADEALRDQLVHGTQNAAPFVGLAWTF